MHSLRTSCVGPIFALAKPHDSVGGKRTRNRIPKEERKTLVESFIKKHQRLNNGSFPSLSLTHKEVGGSFYTVREIVREIIQENRVLGTSDLILEGKGDEHLQDQTLSSSTILMDPVPPLSLSPNGSHLSSEVGDTKSAEDRGSDVLKDIEVSGYQLSEVHESVVSAGISKTQFEGSCGEEKDSKHDSVKTICDSFASKPQDKEVEVDNKDRGIEESPYIESNGTKPVNNDERVNDDEAAMTEMVNVTENTLGTVDLRAEAVFVETFPIKSVTSTMKTSDVQPSEVARVCEGGNGTESKVENDSSAETSVDSLGEIPSSISAVPKEQGTEVTVAVEKKVEKKTGNPASVDAESASTKETVVVNAVIGNIHETKEFMNGSLTTEPTMPKSGTESTRSEVKSVEKTTMGKGKHDASDSSSSQKGNIAPLNRIKPESWKGQSNVAGHEANPLLAVLKSLFTAFVKFWSE